MIVSIDTLPANITVSSITATSATVSWVQPPFSFTPVYYTVTLSRVTGSSQVLCTSVEDNRPSILTMPNVTAIQFTDLHEFSTYRIAVTPRFNVLGLQLTASASTFFNTLSAGK